MDANNAPESPLLDQMVVTDDPVSGASADVQEVRWLPPGRLMEYYDMYRMQDGVASRSTLTDVYRKAWAKFLKFRKHSQHARCASCAKYQAAREQATSKAQHDNVTSGHVEHLKTVFADRAVDARLAALSTQAVSAVPSGQGMDDSTILHILIDGMDQAKFKCPRNICSSKEFEKAWRPPLHIQGCIAQGLWEA